MPKDFLPKQKDKFLKFSSELSELCKKYQIVLSGRVDSTIHIIDISEDQIKWIFKEFPLKEDPENWFMNLELGQIWWVRDIPIEEH